MKLIKKTFTHAVSVLFAFCVAFVLSVTAFAAEPDMAANDFIAAAAAAYYAFSGSDVTDTGNSFDEAVISFITEKLSGVVTGADYGAVS